MSTILAWHGSKSQQTFDAFDPEREGPWKFGVWSTDDREYAELCSDHGHVAAVAVTLERPYRISSERWNAIRDAHHKDGRWFAAWRDKLVEQGYDGLAVDEKRETLAGHAVRTPRIFAAFDPTAVRVLAWNPAPGWTPDEDTGPRPGR